MTQIDRQREMVRSIMSAFAGSGMADAAVFTPAVGDPVDCTVQVDSTTVEAGFETRLKSNERRITAQIAEVGTPKKGDQFTVGAIVYEVERLGDTDSESEVQLICRVSA